MPFRDDKFTAGISAGGETDDTGMINTRILMASSGAAMLALGLGLTFLPGEVVSAFAISPDSDIPVFMQLLGALYISQGVLNWIAKGNPMGGIYGRPIGLANLVHFTIGGLALAKGLTASQRPVPLAIATAAYALFAILFARTVFGPPPFAKRD